MGKKIDINHAYVKTPMRITVDGKTYPINQRNIDVVNKYWETGDEVVLDKLTEISLVF